MRGPFRVSEIDATLRLDPGLIGMLDLAHLADQIGVIAKGLRRVAPGQDHSATRMPGLKPRNSAARY